MPQVSVVVSLYNQGRYLRQCLQSALDQSYKDMEVVVVDDASTDGSQEEARALTSLDPTRVRVFANERNLGVSRTRNHGAYRAKGQVLAFLDADDFWLPGKMEKQMAAFAADPDLGLCHTGVMVVCEPSDQTLGHRTGLGTGKASDVQGLGANGATGAANPADPVAGDAEQDISSSRSFTNWAASFDQFCRDAATFSQLDYFRHLLMANNICLSSVAVRKNVFRQAGGFVDGADCQCEDWLLWLKLSTIARFKAISEQLTAYRFHPDSHTAKVFMNPSFDYSGTRDAVIKAALSFDPARVGRMIELCRA